MGLIFVATLASLFMTGTAPALDFTITGVSVTALYQEPATNTDGSALTDLDHTSIYYDLGAGPVKAKDVPATALTGNGNITTPVDVPVTEGQEKNVIFWVTASDQSGNESAKSATVTKRIDRLAPGPPR